LIKHVFDHVRCEMANILKQLVEGNLDVEVIKKNLSDGKLQVSLLLMVYNHRYFCIIFFSVLVLCILR
jgi:hypothetical protein